eukprot:3777148-Pleurochrysis_carterae.AAC.1
MNTASTNALHALPARTRGQVRTNECKEGRGRGDGNEGGGSGTGGGGDGGGGGKGTGRGSKKKEHKKDGNGAEEELMVPISCNGFGPKKLLQ